MNEIKPVKNINKNPQSFLEMSLMQKKVCSSHKLQDHASGVTESFQIKGRYCVTENFFSI